MKRLIASLLVTVGLVFAQVGTAVGATTRYWKVDIFDPAASTVSRTLNVEYKVFSTIESDNLYNVKLFQNNVEVATQSVDHPYGDSGVFSINIPATGSYTYKIEAVNVDAGQTKLSSEKTVQVVDGPAPTVTTVFVNNTPAGGAGQVAGAGAPAVAAAPEAGAVAGAETGEGQVSAEAANDSQDRGDVLGAEKTEAAKNNKTRNTAIGIAVAVAILGGAYYWFIVRPRNSI